MYELRVNAAMQELQGVITGLAQRCSTLASDLAAETAKVADLEKALAAAKKPAAQEGGGKPK